MNLDDSAVSDQIEDRRGWSKLHAFVSAYTPQPDWDLYKKAFKHPFSPLGDDNDYIPTNKLQEDAGLGAIPVHKKLDISSILPWAGGTPTKFADIPAEKKMVDNPYQFKNNYMGGQPGANIGPYQTNFGTTLNLNNSSAPNILGFVNDLHAAGAPMGDIGSANVRKIDGSDRWSQHAYGNAIDVSQSGRNKVAPDFQKWATDNADTLKNTASKYGMVNGADWKSPDLGHFEFGGGGGVPPAQDVAAAAPPALAPPAKSMPASPIASAAQGAPGGGAAPPMDVAGLLKSLGAPAQAGGNALASAAQAAAKPTGLPFPVAPNTLSTAARRPLPLNLNFIPKIG